MAALLGGLAGYLGGAWARAAMAVTDLVSVAAVAVSADHRAGIDAAECVATGFGTGDVPDFGLAGWTARRACCARPRLLCAIRILYGRRGLPEFVARRLFWIHVLPNLKPVLYAQFWISIPAFILSEANLGILGLGVAEPMPSWGSLLKELEGLVSVGEEPWKFVPLVLLIVVVTSFQLVLSKQEELAA